MDRIVQEVTVILTAIVGVAVLAVLVSRNSNTANVIQSAGAAFAQALNAATGPVTGNPGFSNVGPMGGFTGGLPTY